MRSIACVQRIPGGVGQARCLMVRLVFFIILFLFVAHALKACGAASLVSISRRMLAAGFRPRRADA